MRLVKVRDNKNRPINNLDILVKVLFGDRTPVEFTPNAEYEEGDPVYTLEKDGTLVVWRCNISGKFETCQPPNWSKWTLEDVLELTQNEGSLYESPRMYDTESVVLYGTMVTSENKTTLTAPIKQFNIQNYLNDPNRLEVYIHEEYFDKYLLPSEYTIKDDSIIIDIPPSDVSDKTTISTIWLPEGRPVADGETPQHWYSEDGIKKTYRKPIHIQDLDLGSMYKKPPTNGYKLYDIVIESVHAVTTNSLGVEHMDVIKLEPHSILGYNHNTETTRIVIPVEINADRGFIDELYVTYDVDTQLISCSSKNKYITQVTINARIQKELPSILLIGTKPVNSLTRFVNYYDGVGEVQIAGWDHIIKLPKYELLRYNPFEYELYMNHIHVASSSYEELEDENGNLYVKLYDQSIDWDNTTFVFHITWLICQNLSILKSSDFRKIISPKASYFTYTTYPFIDKYQWIRVWNGGNLIPSSYIIGSQGKINITNINHYFGLNRIATTEIYTILDDEKNKIRRPHTETNAIRSESFPIFKNTKRIPIPFTDYDESCDDFMLFHAGGAHISSTTWFAHDNYIQFYDHNSGLIADDYIDARLIDRDEYTMVNSMFVESTESNQSSFDVGIDLEQFDFVMVFSVSGQFISPLKYTIDKNNIYLKSSSVVTQPLLLDKGDRLEIVTIKYTKPYTRTFFSYKSIPANVDNQTEFLLDEYNPLTDGLLLFQHNGLYIGERFYHVAEDNQTIILDNESHINSGGYLDVIIVKIMNSFIAVDVKGE